MFDASRDISKCSTSMSTKHRVANDAKLCLTPLKTHVFHRVRTSNSPAMLSALLHRVYDILEQGPRGDPICMRTLSSHCRGPFRCISIQHGVLVTVCRLKQKRYVLYSAVSSELDRSKRFTVHPLADLFIPTTTRLHWEAF